MALLLMLIVVNSQLTEEPLKKLSITTNRSARALSSNADVCDIVNFDAPEH